jgi:hypothetical protein
MLQEVGVESHFQLKPNDVHVLLAEDAVACAVHKKTPTVRTYKPLKLKLV